jgi:glyoxylase-like metal-dependent hydrolase (beta-lactamase superfamily II)
MKRLLGMLALLTIALSAETAAAREDMSGIDVVNRAVTAMGGKAALARIKTITISARARHWEPEQSVVADGEMRLAGDSTIVLARDFKAAAARTDWERKLVYPSVREYQFNEVVVGNIGYVQGIDTSSPTKRAADSNPSQHAMSDLRVAAALRELERASPLLALDMQDNPKKLARLPDESRDGKRFNVVAYDWGAYGFNVYFDTQTNLPARVRTVDTDSIQGDSSFDLALSDWRAVNGVKIAHEQAYELNGRKVAEIRLGEVRVNPSLAADTFVIPDAIRAIAVPAATGKVPYQWVIRRQYTGTYLDSSKVSFDPEASPGGLRLEEIAPGVSLVRGGTHNSLIVEMKDYLVVFDAPIGEAQAQWTIEAARTKYADKPVRYLVLTHHHMDHASGARSYAAEGADLIVGAGNGQHFKKVLSAAHKVDPDNLQRVKRRAEIIEVTDKVVLSDGKRELGIYGIENPHASGMLIGYVADAKLGFVTDLWNPGQKLADKLNPGQASLVVAVTRTGITPERFAGGHGGVASYKELTEIAAKSQ